ncbi:MAG: NADH-quinone oxidoreductase subunit J [bacterium]
MWEVFLFYFCGGLMVLSGIMMVASRSAVVAACWLIFAFLNAAGIYALLSAPFLAILQVLVYAGAIMVLFLFVIMMLQEPVLAAERRPAPRWIWPAVCLPLLATATALVVVFRRGGSIGPAATLPEGFGGVNQVAELLLNRYLLAFELISIVLLIAIIGAIALGLVERRRPWR